MKYFTIIISLLSATIFLMLESVVLLYAINNRHYAYYYAWLGVASAFLLFVGRYLREKNKATTSKAAYRLHITIQVITVIVLIAAFGLLGINYYLNEL